MAKDSENEVGTTRVEATPFKRETMLALIIGALGVVYGDIGTSVLYAFRECFNPQHGVPLTHSNVLGILSLIIWVLFLVVTVKYLGFVMKADNEGEGGIFALMARVLAHEDPKRTLLNRTVVVMLGLCGTALFAANGIITPSISVLSAVEGINVAAPSFKNLVLPVTLGILAALFIVQKHGSSKIGAWFGPIMLIWFFAIAAIGVFWIIREPEVLKSFSPYYAYAFFAENRLTGLIVLGAVVLCVTGCEALYADLGHFGLRPIATAWHYLVFPCVVLNYLGQGAMVLEKGQAIIGNPFFEMTSGMAGDVLIYPLVILATAATVIASQALISGMFSLARQAIQLKYLPRLNIIHTSQTMHGQVYIPEVNWLLGIACAAMVLGFRDSSSMAAAYGIAVIGTMATTSLLMFAVEYEQWSWRMWKAILMTLAFLAIDFSFLAGNLSKVWLGGWFTLATGLGVMAILTTWRRGNQAITRFELNQAITIDEFLSSLDQDHVHRIKGTAVFIMTYPDVIPRVLLHHLKHNKVLHEQVLLMFVETESVPMVPSSRRLQVQNLPHGFVKLTIHIGFMQSVDMTEVRRQLSASGVTPDVEISYFIGHVTLRTAARSRLGLPLWRRILFAYLFHNERPPAVFLNIPPNRVVELGEQTDL